MQLDTKMHFSFNFTNELREKNTYHQFTRLFAESSSMLDSIPIEALNLHNQES